MLVQIDIGKNLRSENVAGSVLFGKYVFLTEGCLCRQILSVICIRI